MQLNCKTQIILEAMPLPPLLFCSPYICRLFFILAWSLRFEVPALIFPIHHLYLKPHLLSTPVCWSDSSGFGKPASEHLQGNLIWLSVLQSHPQSHSCVGSAGLMGIKSSEGVLFVTEVSRYHSAQKQQMCWVRAFLNGDFSKWDFTVSYTACQLCDPSALSLSL